MYWALYLWPGLPQLSRHGGWSALAVAIVAATVLNLTLLGSFGWSELLSPEVRRVLWITVGIGWTAAIGYGASRRSADSTANRAAEDDPFPAILDDYLKGNLVQAEQALERVLAAKPRDLEARLLLATLLRHAGRLAEAARQMDILVRLEGAEPWEPEIRQERKLLSEAWQHKWEADDCEEESPENAAHAGQAA